MKHNQTLRRGLGILIALVMCLSLLPVTALAEGTETETADFTEEEKIEDSLNMLRKGGGKATWENNTLTLNGVNFTTTNATAVMLPNNTTIELVGENTITAGNTSYGGASCGICVVGDLTIKGNGTLNVTGGELYNSYGINAGGYWDDNNESFVGGNITISGGTVTANGGEATGEYGESCGIFAYENVNISGGTVTAKGGTANRCSNGIYARYDVNISGGTVTANGYEADNSYADNSFGIYAYEGDVTISGTAKVTAEGGEAYRSHGIYTGSGDVTIKGGTVTTKGGTVTTNSDKAYFSCGIYACYGSVTIFGGTVKAEGGEANYSNGIDADVDVDIKGGTVTANGGKAYENSYGIYAGENVNISGGTVNANGGEADYISRGICSYEGDITISGKDTDVTAEGGTAKWGSYGLDSSLGDVYIKDGTVKATGGEAGEYSDGIYAYEGDVNISGGTVTATGGEVTGDCPVELSYEEYSLEDGYDGESSEPVESYGIESYDGEIIISGGHVIAKTVAENVDATRSAMNMAPNLSRYASYKWRTDDGSFTSSATKAYNYSEDHTYVEIDSDDDNRGFGSSYSLEQITSNSKYAVNVNVSGDGTAKSDKKTAAHGSTVTITVAPDEGCEFIRMVVTDKYGDVIDFVDQGNGEYTFRMPDCNVYVDVYFTTAAVEEPAEKTMILTIGETAAEVNGEYIENDVAPVIRNERTMLPVRFVAEALGATVEWDEAAQKVTIIKGETVIEIYINQPYAFVNNESIELDSPAFIENGRTYLPLRFIVENLGAEVAWDAETQKVIIKY